MPIYESISPSIVPATNTMANGANIKTAASLAGHSTTRHTEKYVHIIDELKQKAVDSLPDLTINYK